MYKLILGLLILLAALTVACGGDDDEDSTAESTPAATEEVTDSATGGDNGSGGTFGSSQLPISVTVTTLEGWEQPSDADLPDLFAVVEPGIGYIDFLQPTEVYSYPTEAQSELGAPPADYVAWFNENPFLTIVATEDVTVGNLQGTRLEITNLDNESFALFKLSEGSDYDLSYGDHITADVLDASGTQIIVICGPEDRANFEQFSESCDEVLATVEFGT
jgi:hypothetical protein